MNLIYLQLKKCNFFKASFQTCVSVLLILGLLTYSYVNAQAVPHEKININLKNTTAENVIREIDRQSSLSFYFDPVQLRELKVKHAYYPNMGLNDVFMHLTKTVGLVFIADGSNISVSKTKITTQIKEVKKGRLTGQVMDDQNEPLAGATIAVEGTTIAAQTNIDGNYSLSLDPGTYTIKYSFISFQTKRISEIKINPGETTTLNVELLPSAKELTQVVVTSTFQRESANGLYAMQKNNPIVTDGISAEQIKRTPDKNIGETLKRISGVSTVDNKYVVVRGLSERYTSATLNGVVMPSTEISRKSFTFDIIPTNLVDNVVVAKTFTPDMPGEFGGGSVLVNTRDLPASDFTSFTIGTSINDQTTGKESKGLQRDNSMYLAKYDAHRNFPENAFIYNGVTEQFPTEASPEDKEKVLQSSKSFSNNWQVYNYVGKPTQNYQFSLGRLLPTKKPNDVFGIIASLNYRNNQNTQQVYSARGGFDQGTNGYRYLFNTSMGGLLGLGFNSPTYKISFQNFYTRQLNSSFYERVGQDAGRSVYNMQDVTEQSVLWQSVLKNEFKLGKNGSRLLLNLGYINLDKESPDSHFLRGDILKTSPSDSSIYNYSNTPQRDRIWQSVKENDFNWDLAYSYPISRTTLKVGYNGWYKDRSFSVKTGTSIGSREYAPLNEMFDYTQGEWNPGQGLVISGIYDDAFKGGMALHAVYAMADQQLGSKWRLVWGARAEYVNISDRNNYILKQQEVFPGYDLSQIAVQEKNWNLMPSVNLTYKITDKTNIRASFAQSIIRPDMRELAYFSIYDYEYDNLLTGSFVKSTKINHYDLRIEWYPAAGQIISASLFYKYMKNPMELQNGGTSSSLINNKYAKNIGLELEVRKSLDFVWSRLKNLSVYGNYTQLLKSEVQQQDLKFELDNTNKTASINYVDAEKVQRPGVGQSDYLLNAGLYFDSKYFGLNASYNYVSNKVYMVANNPGGTQFQYTPGLVDLQLSTRLLKQKAELRFNIANLLNNNTIIYQNNFTPEEFTQIEKEGFKDRKLFRYDKDTDTKIFEANNGRTYSVSFSYNF